MKKSIILSVTIILALSLIMQSCKKDEDITNSNEITRTIDLSSLPTYYNGKLMDNFSEDNYIPTRAADMELTSIVEVGAVHYFDQDLLFYEFCTSNQMEIIYENSVKLSKISRKAIELGLIEGDDETIPQAMADYWQETFQADIRTSMEPCRAALVQLYDGYNFNGNSVIGIWPCRSKLGKLDNKTSSIRFNFGLGATVMCYNKWFGGTRRWYWMLVGSVATLENHSDDNKYSSYFCAGL